MAARPASRASASCWSAVRSRCWRAGVAAAVAAVLVVGTVVTGSGPHSGDPAAGRTGFDPELVSQLHADLVFLLIGLTVALLVALAPPTPPAGSAAPPATCWSWSWRRASSATSSTSPHLPALLVLLHMAGAVLITVYTARLLWSVRGPASELPVGTTLPPPRTAAAAPRGAAVPSKPRPQDRGPSAPNGPAGPAGRVQTQDVGDQGDREQRHVGDRHREQPHRPVGHAAP